MTSRTRHLVAGTRTLTDEELRTLEDVHREGFRTPAEFVVEAQLRGVGGGRDSDVARTLRRWLKERESIYATIPWVFNSAEPDEAKVVLPVLAAVVDATHGRVRAVTLQEAIWLLRLTPHAEGIDPWDLYTLARSCIAAEAMGVGTLHAEVFLGLRGWQPEGRERYRRLINDLPLMARWLVPEASDCPSTTLIRAEAQRIRQFSQGERESSAHGREARE